MTHAAWTRGGELAALGIVFGDIGTSPLYAMQFAFSIDGGAVRPTPGDVLGVLSLIVWSVTLIVSVKYVWLVLWADNDGEGGVMALAALAQRVLHGSGARTLALVATLGALGAALFAGESVITPAISVLSAVQGLEIAAPGLAQLVVPVSVVLIVLLFAAQRWGTQRVGGLFGPVMLVWFAFLAVTGLAEVVRRPDILRALSPSYAVLFVGGHPGTAFIAMGAAVLAVTGAEALYAAVGHFGCTPIRRAWFAVAFPALTLNYLAQGALVLRDPGAAGDPFFLLVPPQARIAAVVLATAATVIASQAVISGTFSIARQAVRLGFLPTMRIRQTSSQAYGQIYVPGVNHLLAVAVVVLVLVFRSAGRLAAAYGVAVTGTFLITTALLLTVARFAWHWSITRVVVTGAVIVPVEVTFVAANLAKIARGGWLTLLLAGAALTVMLTWRRGRVIVTARRTAMEGALTAFVEALPEAPVRRVEGTAVFPHLGEGTTPLALRANVDRNHVVHRQVVIVQARTESVPHVPWSQRLTIDHLGDPRDGITHVTAVFGFQDKISLPAVLSHAAGDGQLESQVAPPEEVTWFVSRITLVRTTEPGMAAWRKRLFLALARNGSSQVELLGLPEERTVLLGAEVAL